jgi:hypothetical protein
MSYLASVQNQPFSRPYLPLPQTTRVTSNTRVIDIPLWLDFGAALRESTQVSQDWQKVGSSVVQVSQNDLQWLERLYTFRRRAEIGYYLWEYPFLVSLLIEASSHISDYFPGSQLFLEVVSDPETGGEGQLVVFVATSFLPQEALDRLDQLDEEWWLGALDRGQGKLCIHVELR